jgi:hypothetical protein
MGPCKNPSPAAVLGPSGTGGPPLPGFGMPPLNPERLLGCREGACEKSGTANNEFDVAWKQTTARSGSQQVAIRYHSSSTRGSLYLVRSASSCEQLIVLVKLKPSVYASIVMQSSVLSIIMLARSQGLSITNTMSCSGPVIHNGELMQPAAGASIGVFLVSTPAGWRRCSGLAVPAAAAPLSRRT